MRRVEWIKEKIMFIIFGIAAVLSIIIFIWIVAILFSGIGTIDLEALGKPVLEDGYFEMIIGTMYLLGGATLIASPIGILAAIYLTEYAPKNRITAFINQSINNLAGVPSIVIGLFGYTFFSKYLGFGVSLLAGWLTLSLMILPIVIRGVEEAIKMVPESFKEAAFSLGLTRWKVSYKIVIPSAAPGIITSILLGIARVAGETVAILFTSCVFITYGLPKSPLEPVMALAFNLYIKIVALGEKPEKVFGVALILFFLVIALSLVAIYLRAYYRRKQLWLR